MKKIFIAVMSLLLASSAFAAFDESHFNYGRQWSSSFNANTDFSGKGLSHLAIWIGDNAQYNQYWEGDMAKACKKNNLTPVFYAYVIAEYDKDQGYVDCDMGSPNHCTNGAQTIRDHWSDIIARYSSYAQGIANDFGTSGTTIWLIEPDFFQYSASGDARSNFNQVGGGIPDDSLCGKYFNDIVHAIRSKLPNAKIAVDISPWMNDFITTWYSNFNPNNVDYLFSSGGRTQGNQSRIRSDNNNNVTWAQASAAMGGKKIIADDGYGVGGGSNNDYQDWMNVNNLNARIADGVIGITIQEPNDSYYSFAASNPISISGGNSSNSGNSSSSAAQSSSSKQSSSSTAPTPSNLTALIDNFEDGDDISEWGGEWSTYTDAGDGGQSTVTTSYSTGYSSSKALKASYTLRKGSLSYDPQVGVTVDLMPDRSTVNLNSCTSISYYYKGAAHAVRMESPLVTDYAFHQASVTAADSWTKKTVTLTSMTQPDWTNATVNVNTARQNVKAFSWQVSGTSGSTGSLEIDNVRCEGLPEPVSSSSSVSSSSQSSSSVSSSSVSSSSQSSSSESSSSSSSSSESSSSVSSSSSVTSSNSTGGSCIAFVNGTGDYGDHCYNSGLNDMEDGKCYTMNPERNPAPQWINGSVTETYWWVETSCGGEESSSSVESSSSAAQSFTITFKNGNTVLQTAEVEQGTFPEYTGAEPTKTATAQYTYNFTGWTPELAAVTGNATYQAKFDSVVNYYSIRFLNGTQLLTTESVAYGSLPVYSGETPVKNADAEYTYAFDGWTPNLVAVTQAATYTAKFTGTKRQYSVTFLDDDGVTVLKESALYDFGTLASDIVQPTNVTKPDNVEYTYEFAGWSPELVDVVDNITYMAVYTATKKKYPVTFVDDDGVTVLLAATEYPYGTRPVNITKPADPTKDTTAEYTYTFAGWTPALAMVKGAATYKASYTATKRKYTVTFVNGDKSTTTQEVEYGTVPTAPEGRTPANTDQYTYTFDGWDKEIVAVTGEVTYTAVVDSTLNKYTVTFVDEDGTSVLKAATAYDYGTAAANIVKPANPTKPGNAGVTYTFSGWAPEIAMVTKNVTYRATYRSSANTYSVTFVDEDGSVLLAAREYDYGTPAADVVTPENPTKAPTAEYTYTFAGWDSEIVAVTADVTYTATYASTKRKYTITFKNGDGSMTSQNVEYGTVPTAPAGKTPANTAKYTYTFVGWTPTVVSVTGSTTYTAKVDSSLNKYSVVFANYDNTELQSSLVEYGTVPVYEGETPVKPSTEVYEYFFKSWDSEIVAVTGAATYKATFRQERIPVSSSSAQESSSSEEIVPSSSSVEVSSSSEKIVESSSSEEVVESSSSEDVEESSSSEIVESSSSDANGIVIIGNLVQEVVKGEVFETITISNVESFNRSYEPGSYIYWLNIDRVGNDLVISHPTYYSTEWMEVGVLTQSFTVNGIQYEISVNIVEASAVSSSSDAVEESSNSEDVEESSSSEIATISSSSRNDVESSSSETFEYSSSSIYVGPSSNSNYAWPSSDSNYDWPSSNGNYVDPSWDNSQAIVAGNIARLNMSFRNNVLTVVAPKQALVCVQVFDMLGNRVKAFQGTFAGTRDVSLQGLPQGSYMVRVVSGSSAKTARVTIK
ncbi:MAG: T9SS type A sorting domain-containing protein [Fibrobacter sp.]|nr:T9SS type A sorting domain-containing protein [Fibrobacter sp.]